MVKDGKEEDKIDANDDDDLLHLIEGEPEHLPGHNCPLSKGGSPEVGGITAKYLHQSWMSSFFVLTLFLRPFHIAHLLVILKLSPANTPWGNTALSSLSI